MLCQKASGSSHDLNVLDPPPCLPALVETVLSMGVRQAQGATLRKKKGLLAVLVSVATPVQDPHSAFNSELLLLASHQPWDASLVSPPTRAVAPELRAVGHRGAPGSAANKSKLWPLGLELALSGAARGDTWPSRAFHALAGRPGSWSRREGSALGRHLSVPEWDQGTRRPPGKPGESRLWSHTLLRVQVTALPFPLRPEDPGQRALALCGHLPQTLLLIMPTCAWTCGDWEVRVGQAPQGSLH